ncbi:MAG: DNA repair protein RecO [Eubacterium sp.]|nr:DNA repair protein RecO [Eubacterium sp.]
MVETMTAVGMVISGTPISEYDKRLVILTKEFGKITAFARGARKPTSQYLGGSQPMAFGEFTLYRGRNAYTVTGMKISDYFSNSMSDIDSMYLGMYFLELADYYGREGIEARDTLELLYLSMKALSKGNISNRLVRCIYELKTLVLNGEYPNVFECGMCGAKDNLDYFDLNHNSVMCRQCRGSIKQENLLDESTIYALQYIITSPINKLYTFQVKETVLEQMENIIGQYIKKVVDKKFNSLDFL